MSKAYPSNLILGQYELLLELLPEDPKRGRPRSISYWEILDVIFYVLREGCTWRGLPSGLSAWQTVYSSK
ncbi:MAG: transposase [Synechococcales cyanobacterium CRU_2_2]|nr:transposase [Synechococcales cyanobacterium CRU_2_2]